MASQNPKIKIPDFQLEIREFLEEFRDKIKNLQSSFNLYNNLVVGVLVLGFLVLIFALVTTLIQSWQINSTFRDENNQLKIQEELIKNTVEQQKDMINSNKNIDDRLKKIEELLTH
jgi:hypothetical protein